MKLPNLKVLWLHDNPCAQADNYRETVIKHLPNLVKLDNHQVTQEERTSSQKVVFNVNPPSPPPAENTPQSYGYEE